jgi:hypothetical protein
MKINTIMKEKKWEVKNWFNKIIKDRYKAMDSLVRAEFLRKDETIQSLKVNFLKK